MCMVVGELTEVSAIVEHAGPAMVRERHEKIRGRDLARQHHDPGQARKRRHRQCLLRRPSVPRQRLSVGDLRQGRHARDDRRRRGRRGATRKIMGGKKDDKALQELPVPERFKWVPKPCARTVRPTTWARCGSSFPRRYVPARISSPTSITRCAATGRWTRSCALRDRATSETYVVTEARSAVKTFNRFAPLSVKLHRASSTRILVSARSHSPTGVISLYFFSVISLAASAARVKSKIEALETSPFRPAVALNMAI